MAIQRMTPKGLGRANPAAATPTTLYTAPASTVAIIQGLQICNTSTTVDDKVRVFVVPSGGSPDNTNAIIYDLVIPVGNPFTINTIPALGAADFISVYSLNGSSTFTASGIEVTGTSNQTFKSFGRSNPAGATPTTLYTATGVVALLQCLMICNTNTTDDKIRVFVVPSAGTAGVSNALLYDVTVQYGNPFAMNTIPTLNAGDFISVYSLNGTSTFTGSGLEMT